MTSLLEWTMASDEVGVWTLKMAGFDIDTCFGIGCVQQQRKKD